MTKWLNQFLDSNSTFKMNEAHLSALSVMSVLIFPHPHQKTEDESKIRTDNTDKLLPKTDLSVLSVPIFSHPDQKIENESKIRTDRTDKLVCASLIADYEERLAIAEYDGLQSAHQSHRIAYVDAFSTVFATLPYEDESTDTQSDWLEKRLQMTRDWLRKQGVERVR